MSLLRLFRPLSHRTRTTARCLTSDAIDAATWNPPRASYQRVMLPDDANTVGNVHGGTILKMIEQCGYIAATRHTNSSSDGDGEENHRRHGRCARVECVDFREPMHVGEVAKLEAEVRYASRASMEVRVTVTAENVFTGEERTTNRAVLWYVAKSNRLEGGVAGPLPQVPGLTAQDVEEGRRRYEAQKRARAMELAAATAADRDNSKLIADRAATCLGSTLTESPPAVDAARTSTSHLSQLILPSDAATSSGTVFGGVIMKLMDNAAAICAMRHCRTNAVTARLGALNFDHPVHSGDLVYVTARPVFSSGRSMEIEVTVEAEALASTSRAARTASGVGDGRMRTTHGFLTFVSLADDGKVLPLPPVVPKTAEERSQFEAGRNRYNERKSKR